MGGPVKPGGERDSVMLVTRPHPASIFARAINPDSEYFRCPELPDGSRFALIGPDPARRPTGYATRQALALGVHRRRGDDALILSPERIRFRDQVRDTVRIDAECPASGRRRLIGHAWIGGADWRALEAALAAIVPTQAMA